jgi:hypothetical protein
MAASMFLSIISKLELVGEISGEEGVTVTVPKGRVLILPMDLDDWCD